MFPLDNDTYMQRLDEAPANRDTLFWKETKIKIIDIECTFRFSISALF